MGSKLSSLSVKRSTGNIGKHAERNDVFKDSYAKFRYVFPGRSRMTKRTYFFLILVFSYFSPVFHFCTLWKRQKTEGYIAFSGGIELVWVEMVCFFFLFHIEKVESQWKLPRKSEYSVPLREKLWNKLSQVFNHLPYIVVFCISQIFYD